MNRYRKTYRFVTLFLLVCFLTSLSGVSANTGHDCCGNCADTVLPHSMPIETERVSSDCCSTRPACTCTFESAGDRDLPAHSLVFVNTTGGTPPTGLATTVSEAFQDLDSLQLTKPPFLSESRPGSGPLYLTHQSFLC